jgi:hypothetical protein
MGVAVLGAGLVTAGCGKPCQDFAVVTIHPDGTGRHRVRGLETEGPTSVAWLPGGQRLATRNRQGLLTMNADGSDKKLVARRASSFAADGTWLDQIYKKKPWDTLRQYESQFVGFSMNHPGRPPNRVLYRQPGTY